MKAAEIRALVEDAIAAYMHTEPEGTLGAPWSEEKVRQHIDLLRECLVDPQLVSFVCADSFEEVQAEPRIRRQYWLVARTEEDDLVFFDEEQGEFGLAQGDPADSPTTIGVRGDLIATFCAR